MNKPIATENGYYLSVRFEKNVGIVIETMGLKRMSRVILDREAARDLANQLDIANLNSMPEK